MGKYINIYKLCVRIADQWSISSYMNLFANTMRKLLLFFILVVMLRESKYLCSFQRKTVSTFDNYKNISTINREANPNFLWELIKGTIRHENIKYATRKKKESTSREEVLMVEINNLTNSNNEVRTAGNIETDLHNKIIELEDLTNI